MAKEENINVNLSLKGATEAMKKMGEAMERLNEGREITFPQPIGHLHCDYAQVAITVYEPIGWFKRLMLRWCFGLEYRAIESED